MAITFQQPGLSRDELERVVEALSVDKDQEEGALQETCFTRGYEACLAGEWECIEPVAHELSRLTDSLGRTLLIRAVTQHKTDVVMGLAKRNIGLLILDRRENSVFDHIGYGAAGLCRASYIHAIVDQVVTSYPKEIAEPFLIGMQKRMFAQKWSTVAADTHYAQAASSKAKLDVLKRVISSLFQVFGYHSRISLSFMLLQHSLEEQIWLLECQQLFQVTGLCPTVN